MPKVNQKPFGKKAKIKIFNFEFPEALKKPPDLLYSNVKGALLAPETRFRCSERGAKKETKAKKRKVRAVGKIGGRKRAVLGRERATNEKGREGAS